MVPAALLHQVDPPGREQQHGRVLEPRGRHADRHAAATQALATPSAGPDGVAMPRSGRSAAEVVKALVGPDKLAPHRQLGVVDAKGTAANHTGADCLPWAGGITDGDVSVQGNILAGAQVLEQMLKAYRAPKGEPLQVRLINALKAGDAAGGER